MPLPAPHPRSFRPYSGRVWWLGHVWLSCSVPQQVQMTLKVSTAEDNTLLCGNRLPVRVNVLPLRARENFAGEGTDISHLNRSATCLWRFICLVQSAEA